MRSPKFPKILKYQKQSTSGQNMVLKDLICTSRFIAHRYTYDVPTESTKRTPKYPKIINFSRSTKLKYSWSKQGT